MRIAIAAIASCVLAASAFGQTDTPFRLRLLVPAYFYPAGEGLKEWEKLFAAHDPAKGIEIVPIFNLDSGVPGETANEEYRKIVERAAAKKMHLLAYVSSKYGKAPIATVKQNIADYWKHYPELGGFFIDEQSSQAKDVPYYAEIREYTMTLTEWKETDDAPGRPRLVGNPGVPCAREYLSKDRKRIMDVAVVFESEDSGSTKDRVAAFKTFTNPAWAKSFAPERFAALVYDCDILRHMKRAKEQKIGWFYVTDAKGRNPWDRLPGYWTKEIAELTDINTPVKQRLNDETKPR